MSETGIHFFEWFSKMKVESRKLKINKGQTIVTIWLRIITVVSPMFSPTRLSSKLQIKAHLGFLRYSLGLWLFNQSYQTLFSDFFHVKLIVPHDIRKYFNYFANSTSIFKVNPCFGVRAFSEPRIIVKNGNNFDPNKKWKKTWFLKNICSRKNWNIKL